MKKKREKDPSKDEDKLENELGRIQRGKCGLFIMKRSRRVCESKEGVRGLMISSWPSLVSWTNHPCPRWKILLFCGFFSWLGGKGKGEAKWVLKRVRRSCLGGLGHL